MLITNDNGVDRPMTKEEIAEHERQSAVTKRELAAAAEAAALRASAKESARAKLAALGLSEAEVSALLGV
jgi:hypothetical protein